MRPLAATIVLGGLAYLLFMQPRTLRVSGASPTRTFQAGEYMGTRPLAVA